uniref:Bm13120 n=1 Tax=Brugia malayi TaxID=6279 RepID=A0A0J9XX68_BRUMA|nr:Bm13120 [Brugia malayi]
MPVINVYNLQLMESASSQVLSTLAHMTDYLRLLSRELSTSLYE